MMLSSHPNRNPARNQFPLRKRTSVKSLFSLDVAVEGQYAPRSLHRQPIGMLHMMGVTCLELDRETVDEIRLDSTSQTVTVLMSTLKHS